MFTGIIESIGRIVRVATVPSGRQFTIDVGPLADDATHGASVCVNGACLTIASIAGSHLTFDAITETIERTTLGDLKAGDQVNLERSLRPDSRLDGHFVQGHVDGTGVIRERTATDRESVLWIEPESSLLPYIVPKGSIAVDGISLTVAALRPNQFSIALIPTTIRDTTLWDRQPGDRVNLETDVIVRTVIHWLGRMEETDESGSLTMSKLREHGFA
jgi:riboflavin synthase